MGWFCKKRFLVLRPQDLLTWVHTMSHIPEQIQHPRHKTMWRRCEEDSTRQGGSHSGKSDSQFGRRAVFTGFSPHRLDGRTHRRGARSTVRSGSVVDAEEQTAPGLRHRPLRTGPAIAGDTGPCITLCWLGRVWKVQGSSERRTGCAGQSSLHSSCRPLRAAPVYAPALGPPGWGRRPPAAAGSDTCCRCHAESRRHTQGSVRQWSTGK